MALRDTDTLTEEKESQEQARARAHAAYLQTQIETVNNNLKRINDLRIDIEKSKETLNETKSSFANGGHSYDGVGLGNTETLSCLNALDLAIEALDRVKGIQNKNLEDLQNQYNTIGVSL